MGEWVPFLITSGLCVVHVATGLLFMLCWPLFSSLPTARYWAAAIPGLITLRFALIGLGVIVEQKTTRSMSRSGNPRELLLGPCMYGVVFVLATVLYWRDSPEGITALVLLCVGDGLAALVGMKYGHAKLPWNRSKSWIGSAAFLLSSLLVTPPYLRLLLGWSWPRLLLYLPALFKITLAGTFVETLPLSDWDNVTVFLTCLLVSKL